MGNFISKRFTRKVDGSANLECKKLAEEHSSTACYAPGKVVGAHFPREATGLEIVIQKDDRRDPSSVVITQARHVTLQGKKGPLLDKQLYEKKKRYNAGSNYLDFKAKLAEAKISVCQKEAELIHLRQTKPKDGFEEHFQPINLDDKEINHALYGGNSDIILVKHELLSIEISRRALQCLKPGAWLNDEVINLYLQLLKEREIREHHRFYRCHYFNTFFYKKLTSGENGYDFRAVRRWTTTKKLGYKLIECDKVFVPIHKYAHWCLAVINIKDKAFQYLDSFGGMDTSVLKVLARYFKEEILDKGDEEVNTSSWKKEQVDDLPLQHNGFDCGMFMIKYIDFCSRGLKPCFSQEHMDYLRRKTVAEILKLRAE